MKVMKIILLRHSEPDYSGVDARGFVGFARDFAPLTQQGIKLAHKASKFPEFSGAEIIVSSPVTRALQTAAIISKNLHLDLTVDIGFHERLPDVQNLLKTQEEIEKSYEEYDACKGVFSDNKLHHWESVEQQISRVKSSLASYMEKFYSKIIIVTHGELMRRFAPGRRDFCGLVEVEYTEGFEFLAGVR